ncbi:MAG: ribosome maturation factor RimP, partial [Porticoccaceae bacterium]
MVKRVNSFFYLFQGLFMQRASAPVVNVIEPVVTGLGYELVGAEFGQAENGVTL